MPNGKIKKKNRKFLLYSYIFLYRLDVMYAVFAVDINRCFEQVEFSAFTRLVFLFRASMTNSKKNCSSDFYKAFEDNDIKRTRVAVSENTYNINFLGGERSKSVIFQLQYSIIFLNQNILIFIFIYFLNTIWFSVILLVYALLVYGWKPWLSATPLLLLGVSSVLSASEVSTSSTTKYMYHKHYRTVLLYTSFIYFY